MQFKFIERTMIMLISSQAVGYRDEERNAENVPYFIHSVDDVIQIHPEDNDHACILTGRQVVVLDNPICRTRFTTTSTQFSQIKLQPDLNKSQKRIIAEFGVSKFSYGWVRDAPLDTI